MRPPSKSQLKENISLNLQMDTEALVKKYTNNTSSRREVDYENHRYNPTKGRSRVNPLPISSSNAAYSYPKDSFLPKIISKSTKNAGAIKLPYAPGPKFSKKMVARESRTAEGSKNSRSKSNSKKFFNKRGGKHTLLSSAKHSKKGSAHKRYGGSRSSNSEPLYLRPLNKEQLKEVFLKYKSSIEARLNSLQVGTPTTHSTKNAKTISNGE